MTLAQNTPSNLELHSHQRGDRHLDVLTSQPNEVFEYPILGIGRTSTQTTLASIETLAGGHQSHQGDVEVASGQDQRILNSSTPLPHLRVDTSQLSIITEGISPARQSPSPSTLPNSRVSTSADSTSHNEVSNNDQSRGDQEQEITTQEAARPTKAPRTNAASKSSPTFRSKVSQRGLRDRLRKHLRKPRKFDVHRLGLHFHFEVSGTPSASGEPDGEQVDVHEEHIAQLPALTDDLHVETGNTPEALIAIPTMPTPADTAVSLQPPESGHPDPVGANAPAQHEKYERIRMRRRELTLKRRAEMMSKCECPSGCHCWQNSVRSDAASQGNESERSLQVPDHYLRNHLSESSDSSASRSSSSVARAILLTDIGVHLPSEQGHRHSDDSNNTAVESQQAMNDRLSQASTAYLRSNGSSISLSSRRPASLRRSNSTPMFVVRRSTDGVRPDLLPVLQNPNIPGRAPDTVSETHGSPYRRTSDTEESPAQVLVNRE
ncbi:MAG: hypothetical protein Q9179_001039 [Wetmoreana sp. 5 TL-2023]